MGAIALGDDEQSGTAHKATVAEHIETSKSRSSFALNP